MAEILGDEWKYNPEYNRIAEMLGVDRFDRESLEIAKKISLVRDYVDLIDGKVSSESEALQKIYGMKKQLGTNDQGTTLLNQLFQHARLDMDTRKLDAVTPKEQTKKEEPKEQKFDLKKVVQQTIEGVIQGVIKQSKVKEEVKPTPQVEGMI